MSEVTPDIGQRIAAARKLAGMTQAQLAQAASYSLPMVRAVEQAREPASPAFLAAASRALGMEPEQFTGQPYRDDDSNLEGLADLRSLLAEGSYVRVAPPAPLEELRADLNEIQRLYREDRGKQSLQRLPVLLRQLHGAAHAAQSDSESGQVHSLLASAYTTAERLCRRFGFLTLAIPSLDRMQWAASLADDPLYLPQTMVKRARVLMYYDTFATDLVENALDLIEGDSEEAVSVRGYSHLCGAIVAARGRDKETAQEHLSEAGELASGIRGESDLYGTLFGKSNVAIHETAVSLEIGHPERAAEKGSAIQLSDDVAPPRQGHHWQDVARAWLLAGDPAKSLNALNTARRVAPQQTRSHPQVRETVRLIAAAERRRTDSLSAFTGWLGTPVA